MEAIKYNEIRALYEMDRASYDQVHESIRAYEVAKSNSKRRYGIADFALADKEAAFKAAWDAISPFVGEDDEMFSVVKREHWQRAVINKINDVMNGIAGHAQMAAQ